MQDRLVKELRLAGISIMDAGNAFLPGFTKRFNVQFANVRAKQNNLHRALSLEPDRLAEVFAYAPLVQLNIHCQAMDQRQVTKNLMLRYDRKRIKLETSELTRSLVGKFVDVDEYGCGSIQVRAGGVVLPHTIMNPERRMTHAAITENKRLSAVLEHIKAEQGKAPPKVKVKPLSAKNGNEKKGQDCTGKSSKLDRHYVQKRADQVARTGSQGSDI